LACNEDADEPQCPSSVDALLSEVGESIPDRHDCGSFNSGTPEVIVDALSCLFAEDGSIELPTQLAVNRCIDCLIESTYVVTADRQIFHVLREADQFSDNQHRYEVETCANIVEDDSKVIRCVDAEPLYDCRTSADMEP
jgi:hypothetical protein